MRIANKVGDFRLWTDFDMFGYFCKVDILKNNDESNFLLKHAIFLSKDFYVLFCTLNYFIHLIKC